MREKSHKYYKKACKLMPGGVNSPVRAFNAVGGKPLFIQKGQGARIFDIDGNSYIDYVLSWGPLILGHAHKRVVKAIQKVASDGTSFGAPTKAEVEIAKLIVSAFPSIEKVRLVNSGTEAAMSAIRLARAYTEKDKIIKFEGCYHGHSDGLLVEAGSGTATFGIPTSAGVLQDCAKNTIVLAYNNVQSIRSTIQSHHEQIAAVIIEPICGNMGVVLPELGFLTELRKLTRMYGVLLIFDEVITGFRFCFGGVQNLFNIKADITCLGKIIGGGMPIGAYGASKEIMSRVSPEGKMYQAGTLSGNHIAIACGIETLQVLKTMNYNNLNMLCEDLCVQLEKTAKTGKINFTINRFGSMFTVFFVKGPVSDYKKAARSSAKNYALYFNNMLKQGVYCAPSQFEANFLSFAHTKKDIEYTVKAFKKIIRKF